MTDKLVIPNHIAIIMDGNGRWATQQGKTRTTGHKAGSNNIKKICKKADELGVRYITVYAFSTENWKRPQREVDFLMNLLRQYLKDSIKKARKDNMRVRVIGNRHELAADIVAAIEELEEASKDATGLTLIIALNYGGRDEILRGMKKIAQKIEDKSLKIEEIQESTINMALDTWDIPDPELMIRTSGEMRLSNFLLWQLAYAEFYFTQLHWPDFKEDELMKAIIYYSSRQRRFGGI